MASGNFDDRSLPGAPSPTPMQTGMMHDRPWIFGLLIGPSAVVANGIVQGGVLAYLLSQQGMKIDLASHWISILALPTSLYFLWSPITDFLLKRRTWLLLSSLGAALLVLIAFRRGNLTEALPLRLILISGCLVQLVVSSCGGMMGALHSDRSRQMASSFYQAGSMALGAIATWVLIRESSRVPPATLGWIAAAMIGVPGLFAYLAPAQPEVRTSGFWQTLKVIGTECKSTFARWDAVPYLMILSLPLGTGAAVGLLPGIARGYGVGGDQVAWINGLLGASLVAAGSMTITLLPPRWGVIRPYLLACIVNALMLAGLAFGAMRPSTYFAGTLLYLFTIGCCYSLTTAVALEFMGASGKSGSGRYSVINSLTNVPVLYMIWADGWGAAHWGIRGLPGMESVMEMLAAGSLLVYVWLKPPRRTVVEMPLASD